MDLIDREQAIAIIDELNVVLFYEANEHSREAYKDIRIAIEQLPSADKTGKWLHTDVVHIVTNLIEGDAPQSLTCSRCGFKHRFADEYGYSCIWHYCPNCGARMVGD